MKKLLLFDIDGTLIKTGGAGLRGFARACHEVLGIENLWDGVRVDGRTDSSLLKEIARQRLGRDITEQEFNSAASKYFEHLPLELEKTPAYEILPGVLELIETLSRLPNIVLGLQTGNFEKSAYLKLSHGKLDRYFNFGGFGSDSDDRPTLVRHAITKAEKFSRQRFEPSNIFVIGDTEHDVLAGQANGAKTLAVFTGWTPRETVTASNPDYTMESFAELDAFLKIIESVPS